MMCSVILFNLIISPLASSSLCSLSFSTMPFLADYLINTVTLSTVNCIWVLWVPFVTRKVSQLLESLFSLNDKCTFYKKYIFFPNMPFLHPEKQCHLRPLAVESDTVLGNVLLLHQCSCCPLWTSPPVWTVQLKTDCYLNFGIQFLYSQTWRDWSRGLN